MKKILSIALLTFGISTLSFADNLIVMPFAGNTNYDSNSKKDSGKFYGIYLKGFGGFSNNYIEFNYQHDDIEYKNAQSDYKQNSISIIYNSIPSNKKYKTKFGFNYLNINDQENVNKDDYVYIFGTETYLPKSILGFDAYYVKLNKNDIDHTWQFSPYLSFYTGKLGRLGTLYTKIQYNYISLKNNNPIDGKNDYHNYDVIFTSYNPNGYTTTITASFGKNSYKVDKGGFVLYNMGEIINHSYSITENITVGKKKDKFIKLGIKKTNVTDYDVNNNLQEFNNYTFSVMGGILF